MTKVPSALRGWRHRHGVVARGAVVAGALSLLATTGVVAMSAPAQAGVRREVVVTLWKSPHDGKVLVTTRGFALYTYGRDRKDHSNCAGGCLALWPPLLVAKGVVPLGRGVAGIGVMTRSNGQRQVTFRGLPLYLFKSDTRRDEVNGQNVADFHVAHLGPLTVTKTKSTTTTTTKSGYGY